MQFEADTFVLIAGAGPAGLALSLTLSRRRVPHVIISKHPGTANSPRAHIVNQRTMEIFRDLGVEDAVKAVATPSEMMVNNVWSTSLSGLELARLEAWGTGVERAADYRRASPSAMCNCPQHILEPVLADAIRAAEVADLRFGHELVGFDRDAEGVTVRVKIRATGEEYGIRCRYLVGADGGRSRVAEDLGVTMEGPGALASAANVWFRADLSRYCAHRPGTLFWNASPGKDYFIGAGTLICIQPWDEWVMLFMYDPAVDPVDTNDQEAVKHRIRKVVGDPDLDIDVKAISLWTINDMVADRFGEGRVLLVGDAAHRHPPSNGLGLNTCVADGFNLGWKLALVAQGKADATLIDTYDQERRPVGQQVVRRAIQSIVDMAAIPDALGFHPDQSEEEGWANIDLLFSAGEAGAAKRKAFGAAIELTNYQFNAQGVELGYRYRAGAVVHDASDPEPAPDRDPQLFYQPTTWPGARVPHAWIEKDGRLVSTLDVTGQGRFVLMTGIGGEGWKEAAATAAQACGVPVETIFIGQRNEYQDVYDQWAKVREVAEDGCVLVRPDGHVAWRHATGGADGLARLPAVMAQLLGRVDTSEPSSGNA